MIAARTWRGEPTTAEALLRRYNLRIEPAPDSAAWRIASIEETHGRAELRVICRGATLPVTIDWRTSAGLSIPVHTDAAGAVNLTVNADSYYVPERGPGPHRVQPAGAADAIVGWGLALGLPDAPPAEIDNRYLTVIVTWEYGVRVGGSGEPEGEHCAASERGTTPVSGVVTTVRPNTMLIGMELPNRPQVFPDEWACFDALGSTIAKMRPYHLTPEIVTELARRGVAVAVRPNADGDFASGPDRVNTTLIVAAQTLRSAGVSRIYLIPDSEPNLGNGSIPAHYWETLNRAVTRLRPTGARLVSPPFAVAQGDDTWLNAGKHVLDCFDCLGVHAYGQLDDGLVLRTLRLAGDRPLFAAEVGDSSVGSSAEQRGEAVSGYLRLLRNAGAEAACLFLLGTADPAWDRFVLPESVLRTINTTQQGAIVATITPIPADLRPLLARLCGQYQADEAVIAAMVDIESGWNPNATGDDGHSIGLLQLHDAGLGANMSVSARQDPETNLRTGIRAHVAYLREFGTIEAAIAAHNAGGPAVRAVNGDWEALYDGTVASRYVRPVLARAERYRDELTEANGIDPDVLRIQLDAIWGVSEKLLAGRADREAWLLRQAVIAIKDEVHLH